MNPLQNKAQQIRERLKQGELITGAYVFYSDPAIAETFGYMGFDYVWIDGEHCALDKQTILGHVVGTYAGGAASIVRVAWNDPVLIKPILEMGIDGLIVPLVTTAEEARAMVEACSYPPEGIRGFGPRRANQYGALSNAQYLENVNDSFLRIVQIEHKTAVENLDEILKVKGIDAFMVGQNDLAATYGHLGDVTAPEMTAVYDLIAQKCREAGMPFGVALGPGPGNKIMIAEWVKRGAQLISCADDISSLNLVSRDMLSFVHSL